MIDYSRFAAEYGKHRQVHPGVLEGLVSDGKVEGSSKVLEVGCGTGNYVGRISQLKPASCYGIDPAEQMLSVAKERLPALDFSIGKAEKLEFNSDYFDLVFTVDVIHHVADLSSYFREAYRVLKRGGRICTATDSEWTIRNRKPLSSYFPETVAVELDRYPPISRIERLMLDSGFGDVKEKMVEFPYDLTDMLGYRARVFSSLRLISEEAFQRGLQRMEADLAKGTIPCVSRYSLIWGTK